MYTGARGLGRPRGGGGISEALDGMTECGPCARYPDMAFEASRWRWPLRDPVVDIFRHRDDFHDPCSACIVDFRLCARR